MDKDIEFDRYGDMSFIGNDISLTNNEFDYKYQHIIDRLITNFDDYYLTPNVGADLSSYIGSRVNSALEENIISSIRISLTRDLLVATESLDIITLIDKDTVLIKIQIGGAAYQAETIIINSIFNTSSGLFYVTN